MKTFAFSDLNRQSGEVLDTALVEPVTLEKRGKPKIVMMPVAMYTILIHGRAFTIEEAPNEVNDLLKSAIDDAMKAD